MLHWLLWLLLVADGERRFVLDTTPFQQTDREIVLADVRLFRVTSDYAVYMAWLSRQHKEHFAGQVTTWNTPANAWRWDEECDWRRLCWATLAVALGEIPKWADATASRINALYELRELIGREAFYAGQMPCPTPSYKTLPNR